MALEFKDKLLSLFDREYYLEKHTDVAAAGIDPLVHFRLFGAEELREFSPFFDADFYARSNPDVVEEGINLIQHYVNNGIEENRAPGQFFDVEYYLSNNIDVVEAGANPFEHFVNHGAAEGRAPSGFFDTSYYLEQNPDVLAAGINALEHFINHGIKELRDPNANFDMDVIFQNNTVFSQAIQSGNETIFQKVIKDAAETVNSGGTIEQAISVAQISSGDQDAAAPEPTVTGGEDTTSGGEDTTGSGTGSGTGGFSTPISPLTMNEAGGTLTIAGTSEGTLAVRLDTNAGTAEENGKVINLITGDITSVSTITASGITNIGLNLLSVRSGVATTITGTGQADTLNGGSAGDNISGGGGADSIIGGAAADTITGGAAADTIVHNGTTHGLDIVTDFLPGADLLSSTLNASDFTYLTISGGRIVSNAANGQGWQFSTAAGAANATGMHLQEFDVTNAGSGTGKFMSEVDNSAGVTGSAAGDLIVLGGTTSGKTVNAGTGNDRIIDTTINANIINGEAGNDTMSGSDGADTFTGGADADRFVSTFGSGANDGLDIIVDFTGADDSLDITLNAGALTYSDANNTLVSVADNTQGFRFVAVDGSTDNNTGLDHVNFDETNLGAGGGKIMSMVDNSAGLTGSGNGDLLYVFGTTASKVISGAGGNDNIIDASANANNLQGGGGNDTIAAGGGNDTVSGGNGTDIISLGAGTDTLIRAAADDLDIITDFTGADDTFDFASAASAFTYLSASNSLVLASDATEGVRFTDAAGVNNNTGLDDVEFDETNTGAGGGKFMSKLNNGGHLTGDTGKDLLFVSGTTNNRNIDGAGDNDRIISEAAGANDLIGNSGNDTIVSGAGADTVNGGDGNDVMTLGAGNDIVTRVATDDLDIITDFTGADDTFDFASAASEFTYIAATNSLVLAADSTQGVRFTSAAGANNNTGLDDVEFDETNTGTGVGKFMSEINNSAGLTGSGSGDLLIFAGTTSGKTVAAGGGGDRILDLSNNGNTLNGEAGDDTIEGGAGADAINGGAGADSLIGGDGADTYTVTDDADILILTESGNDGDNIQVTARTGAGSTVTGFDISGAGTDDIFTFNEAAFINGNAGAKNVVGVSAASASPFDVETADFMGTIVVTDNTVANFSDAHTVIAAAISNEAANDAFVVVIDNGTIARVVAWDDRVANGGNADGVVDNAELLTIATLNGIADVSAFDTGNLAIA